MLLKSQLKYIQTLGHKKFRDANGVFVAEGPKIVGELLRSKNVRLIQCFALAGWLQANDRFLSKEESEIIEISEQELERISFHSSPNQVVAVFTKPVFHNGSLNGGITLLLDAIQDPGNLGTIIRTADWFNVKQIICSRDTVDIFNPKVVQSAMGSIVRVEVIHGELTAFLRNRPAIPVYAASLDGSDLQVKINTREAILLLGNESKGLTEELKLLATKKIRVPGKGGAESLNVAVACGILLSMIEVAS
jgi:RNA methyltransferase, TrmH family